ncbi:MAG TPA: hypothetical protein VMT16_01705 [Thermoanaerobaculia bacterium]|nr:hypothetical protein [Thermoanaerobaculia bacterium]
MRHTLSVCAAALALLGSPASAVSDGTLVPLDPEAHAAYRAARDAALTPVSSATLSTRDAGASSSLLLPFYEIDRRQQFASTTLFGLRNPRNTASAVGIDYYDRMGHRLRSDNYTLPAAASLTFNLRDNPALTAEGDGFARGYVVVTTDGQLTGEGFQVDPSQDHATGERLLDLSGDPLCSLWESRYMVGGTFSGGTRLTLLVGDPRQPGGKEDEHGAVFELFDEAGRSYGSVALLTNLVVNRIDLADVRAQLPGAPELGVVEIYFNGTGGLAMVDYSAEGRYSVGMAAACLAPMQ